MDSVSHSRASSSSHRTPMLHRGSTLAILPLLSLVIRSSQSTQGRRRRMLEQPWRNCARSPVFPITDVIVTHAHWDHIGGLNALLDTGTQIVAQADFAGELRIVHESGVA